MEAVPSSEEIRLYLDAAQRDLETAEKKNLGLGYYHVVVSRAYYAMFYAAHAMLASKDITRSKHSGVHSAFGQFFVKTGLIEPKYAKMLINAFNARVDSDYETIYIADKKTAEPILQNANQFVNRIEDYFEGTV